ncbi:restriction endonuclease subunit S [Streptomyces xiamenensis]
MSAGKVENGGGVGRSRLPEGWAWATLDDLAEVAGGVTKDAKRQSDPSLPRVPYLRVANVQRMKLDLGEVATIRVPADAVERYRLQPGDVLMTEGGDRDKLGRGWVWEGQIDTCIHQNHVFRARITGSAIEPKLLALYLNSVARPWLEANAKQSVNLASISISKIKQLPVAVPPIAEQQRIAVVLDAHLARLDAIEARLGAALEHLDALQNSTMAAAATGLLDPKAVPASSPTSPDADLDGGALPELAEGWRWSRLSDMAEVVGGVTKDSKRQADEALPEVPYLRVANAQRARLDLSQVTKIRVPAKTLSKLRLESGDLLLTEGGDRDKLGRGWIWEDQIEDCIHQNHLFRARIQHAITQPKLLAWYTNSAARGWFESHAKQSVNLASISMSKVRNLPVPIPPRAEQLEAVAAGERSLGHLTVLAELTRQAVAHTATLRRVLLADAFSGCHVPQDPADEPAEDLLKRIRVEREIAEAERKVARKAARSRAKTAAPVPAARRDDTTLADGEQTTLPLEFNS